MASERPKSPVAVLGAPQLENVVSDTSHSHSLALNRHDMVTSTVANLIYAAVPHAIDAAHTHGVDITFLGGRRTNADFIRDMVVEQSELSSPVIQTVDLGTASRQLSKFHLELPGVRVFYAIKCLPDVMLISLLARLGASFDCASGVELSIVHNELCAIGRGDAAFIRDHILFANPVKNVDDLCLARRLGVTYVTVDSTEEMHKLSRHLPEAQVIIRICTDDSSAQISLSEKFGAQLSEVDDILRSAVDLGISVVGAAFHVGFGPRQAQPYRHALKSARDVFVLAQTYGMSLNIVDIGGGFPGTEGDVNVTFDEIARVVRDTLNEMFPRHVRVFAEPGQFLAKSCVTLATRVLRTDWSESRVKCTLGDGVYGAFRDAHALGARFPPALLWSATPPCESPQQRQTVCDLVGPTMQNEDVIERDVVLPPVAPGDWLVFHNMGAYSQATRTLRKDLPKPTLKYVFTTTS